MSDLKDKAKKQIDSAAASAKNVSDKIIDKSKDAVHMAGKTLETQGKRLRNV